MKIKALVMKPPKKIGKQLYEMNVEILERNITIRARQFPKVRRGSDINIEIQNKLITKGE
jgi:hypothetical protein